MEHKPVLSIFIATYNRKEILVDKLKSILHLNSDEFDIFVLDDGSDDGTREALQQFDDKRLHIYQNSERQGLKDNGVMQNWYQLLEHCDGMFALHLNDRDLIDTNGLMELIAFLKERPTLMGGICNLRGKAALYSSPDEAFMAIPYFGSHPTGIVFNVAEYKLLDDRQMMFTKQESYIHPHDLVLGKLAEYGDMFRFKKIWNLADEKSFSENRSFLYKKGSIDDAWFSPVERTKEYELFVKGISKAAFSNRVKALKAQQIAKRYLFYCTLNYAFFISDKGQTAHYGIEPRKLSRKEITECARQFISKSYEIMSAEQLISARWSYQVKMTAYFWVIYFGKPIWDKVKKIKKNQGSVL